MNAVDLLQTISLICAWVVILYSRWIFTHHCDDDTHDGMSHSVNFGKEIDNNAS